MGDRGRGGGEGEFLFHERRAPVCGEEEVPEMDNGDGHTTW